MSLVFYLTTSFKQTPNKCMIAIIVILFTMSVSSLALLTPKDNKIITNSKLENVVIVNKCCEHFEIHVDGSCSQVNESDYYKPLFTGYNGKQNVKVPYEFVVGVPRCGTRQLWRVYHSLGSPDELVLLEDGKLRHYTRSDDNDIHDDYDGEDDDSTEDHKNSFHDYVQGQYCLDKAMSNTHPQKLYASICLSQESVTWGDPNFFIRKVLNPIFHGICLIILLLIAIIYFILPTLRDLVGNIVTTICTCLMIQQAADLVRLFTEFTNHVSIILADIIMYTSILSSFLWLNSLGYYIWKTFRSRNVFLRVTDGRKYCYYSACVWSLTIILAGTGVFAHFYLDTDLYKKQNVVAEQETIGFLGRIVFFSPVASTIVISIFFFITTLKLINRRNVYGRIQHKLKSNFIMFSLMLLIMSVSYIFLIFASFNYDGFVYVYIFVSAIEMPLLFYVCVIRQKHVTYLLKKSCCHHEPPSANDWGDEMNYMNCNEY